MHISSLEHRHRTAWILKDADLLDNDHYHQTIHRHAKRLYQMSSAGDGTKWIYIGQNSAGTTIWKHRSSDRTAVVKDNQPIDFSA